MTIGFEIDVKILTQFLKQTWFPYITPIICLIRINWIREELIDSPKCPTSPSKILSCTLLFPSGRKEGRKRAWFRPIQQIFIRCLLNARCDVYFRDRKTTIWHIPRFSEHPVIFPVSKAHSDTCAWTVPSALPPADPYEGFWTQLHKCLPLRCFSWHSWPNPACL